VLELPGLGVEDGQGRVAPVADQQAGVVRGQGQELGHPADAVGGVPLLLLHRVPVHERGGDRRAGGAVVIRLDAGALAPGQLVVGDVGVPAVLGPRGLHRRAVDHAGQAVDAHGVRVHGVLERLDDLAAPGVEEHDVVPVHHVVGDREPVLIGDDGLRRQAGVLDGLHAGQLGGVGRREVGRIHGGRALGLALRRARLATGGPAGRAARCPRVLGGGRTGLRGASGLPAVRARAAGEQQARGEQDGGGPQRPMAGGADAAQRTGAGGVVGGVVGTVQSRHGVLQGMRWAAGRPTSPPDTGPAYRGGRWRSSRASHRSASRARARVLRVSPVR